MSERHDPYPCPYPWAPSGVPSPAHPSGAPVHPTHHAALDCEALVNLALVGAVVGGAAAAARNAHRVRSGHLEVADALLATGRGAVASAAATALAGAAAHALTREGVARVALMLGVGAAVLYGLGPWVEGGRAL